MIPSFIDHKPWVYKVLKKTEGRWVLKLSGNVIVVVVVVVIVVEVVVVKVVVVVVVVVQVDY